MISGRNKVTLNRMHFGYTAVTHGYLMDDDVEQLPPFTLCVTPLF